MTMKISKVARISLNFRQILTKFFRDFPKMQHFSEKCWKKRLAKTVFPGRRENGPKTVGMGKRENDGKREKADLQI